MARKRWHYNKWHVRFAYVWRHDVVCKETGSWFPHMTKTPHTCQQVVCKSLQPGLYFFVHGLLIFAIWVVFYLQELIKYLKRTNRTVRSYTYVYLKHSMYLEFQILIRSFEHSFNILILKRIYKWAYVIIQFFWENDATI